MERRDGDTGRETRIEGLLAELLTRIEASSGFEAESFLAEHPDEAAILRARVELLRKGGLIGGKRDEPSADASQSGIDREFTARFRLGDEIGRGGMGTVLRAFDRDLHREVALKQIRDASREDPERVRRFVEEARIAGALEHPSIVPVHELGVGASGDPYYTMKLVEGRTLREIVDRIRAGDAEQAREFTLPRRIEVMLRVCDALRYAHSRNVLHRDLTPNNVMIGSFGEVQVMDWGLAKRTGAGEAITARDDATDEASEPQTLAGAELGTPGYRAPELQFGRVAEIDARTDVFGAGAVLHYLLEGRAPDVEQKRALPAAGGRIWPEPPRELLAVCRRALEPRREDRYPSIDALAADLRAYLEDRRGDAWTDGPVARLVKWTRRRPSLAVTSGMIGIVAFVSVIVAIRFAAVRAENLRMTREREKTELQRALAAREAERVNLVPVRGDIPRTMACAAILSRYVADLTRFGLPFGTVPPEATVAAIREIGESDPALRRELLTALYGMAELIDNTPFGWMAWQREKNPDHVLPPGLDERLLPWRAALFEVLSAADPDPWHRAVWTAFREFHDTQAATTFAPALPTEIQSEPVAERLEWLGRLFHIAGERQESRRAFERVIEVDPSSFWAHFYLGLYAYNASPQDLLGAVRHGDASVALRPDIAFVWVNRGVSLDAMEREREAKDSYRRAIELDPSFSDTWYNLGLLLADLGEFDEAEACLARAAALAPLDPAALRELGWVMGTRDLGRDESMRDDALRLALQAWYLTPDDPLCARRAGLALRMRAVINSTDAAIVSAVHALRRAVELDPKAADSWKELALAEQDALEIGGGTGVSEEALRCMACAIALAPEDAEARAMLAELEGRGR